MVDRGSQLLVASKQKTMKTMRSLLSKLQGITPDPSPTIRFRRDLVPHSPPQHPHRLRHIMANPPARELLVQPLASPPQRAVAGDHGAPPAAGPLRRPAGVAPLRGALPLRRVLKVPPANRGDRPGDGGAERAPAAARPSQAQGQDGASYPFHPGGRV
ncbi:hypothetical protein CGCA056_v009323 [Colletotrichum aenigma]|uniref:uncharacterized protein n=1 Tax=Colletotrichum aenigma TaxID=1215731 RepID=UPI0018728438|nr:uncharacterized protein CGCA056_v009323 [Colletotrichum aenigma]KAF5518745.1 hypothetical protein CGCA056_v009323 [Colletotrichum aenigma]